MSALLTLLSSYYLCDAVARERVLTRAEWQACSATYHAVKLAFIDGVSVADYAALSPREQAAVAAAAYAAFKSWEAANPQTVAELRAG